MKKLLLWTLPFFVVMPAIGIAATCAPYKNVIYSFQANGANGTLTKSQTCTEDSNSGSYSITSQINVSKGFFSKEINQTATGTYASPNTIVAQNFTNSNNSASLPTGDLDTLSLVFYLSSSLSANITTFPATLVFYNGNTITVQCAVTNANITVTTGTGAVIPATQISCPTADNSIILTYSFSQDLLAIMLAATSTENGTETLSAIINNE